MKRIFLILSLFCSAKCVVAQTISGGLEICPGAVTTLSCDSFGGFWTSGATAIATVDSFSGDVTGHGPGAAIITYYVPGSGTVAATVTVDPAPVPIGGSTAICQSGSATFTCATPGGVWSSGNYAIADIDAVTGVAMGTGADTVSVWYTLPTGCAGSALLTVNPLPYPITAPGRVCIGATDTLYEFEPGTWSSPQAPSLITLGATAGDITGVATGVATITFTLPTGCMTTTSVSVNPMPHAGVISGKDILCLGDSTNFTSNASYGVWSSTDATVATVGSGSGVVTAQGPGGAAIIYTVTNVCGTDAAISGWVCSL